MHCEFRKFALVLQPPSRDRVDRKSRQRARQTAGAKIMFFDIHLFCINMPPLFTFFRRCLYSSYKIGNILRCGRPKDRFSIPSSSRLLCSNPHTPDLIKGRTTILFKGHQALFFCGDRLQRATPIIVGYVAGLTWKNRSIWYN